MDPLASYAGVSLFSSRGGAILEELKAHRRAERVGEPPTVKMGFSLLASRSVSWLSLFYTSLPSYNFLLLFQRLKQNT